MTWLSKVVASSQVSESTRWRNKDIIPLPPSRRRWGKAAFGGFWSIASVNVSCWMSASSLLPLGLSFGQVLSIVVVGNVVIAAACLINSHQGAKWHIGFTVSQRVIFGIYGSYVPVILRILLCIVWYASQAWIGGLAIAAMISSWSYSYLTMRDTFPESMAATPRDMIGFVIFHVLSYPLMWIPPERINKPTIVANVVTFIAMMVVAIWSGCVSDVYYRNDTLLAPGTSVAFNWIFGFTTWFGALATSIVCQSDYSRFSKTKYSAIPGTVFAFAVPGILVPIFGIITAFSTANLYGSGFIWNPLDLAFHWMNQNYSPGNRAAAFFLSLAVLLSQLCLNILNNGFTGGMDLCGLFPKLITIKRGTILITLLSWATQPWNFYSTSSTFLDVMSSFAVFLSPLIGVMCCDFYFIRHRTVALVDLYKCDPESSYFYTYGINFRALVAWSVTMALALPGMINSITPSIWVPRGLRNYYAGSSILGILVGGGIYFVMCLIFPIQNATKTDDVDYFGTFTTNEALALGIIPHEPTVIIDHDQAHQLTELPATTADVNESLAKIP